MVSERWFPSVGGGEYHLLHLVRGLLERDVEILLVCRDLIGTVRPEGSEGEPRFQVIRVPPRSAFGDPVGRSVYPLFLVRAATRGGPFDLIHVHCPLGSFPSAYLRRRWRVPLVRTVHGVYQGRWEGLLGRGPRARLYASLEALSLSLRYDALVTVDQRALQEGLRGVTPEPRWIPNGVDVDRFEGVSQEGFPTPTFLFVGRLVAQKGVRHLLEACERLEASGEKFEVLLVGNGPERDALERWTTTRGLRSPRFLGTVGEEELTRLYAKADAFVLPSLWEGLPLTLLEAWAARRPVVATAVGGVPDVAQEGENALLVNPGDGRALAEAMGQLLRDESLRRRLGAAGHRLVGERFSWERVVSETLALYTDCLNAA